MEFWTYLLGAVRSCLVSADISGALSQLVDRGFHIYRIQHRDALTTEFTVSRREYAQIQKICYKRGEQIEVLSYIGLYWSVQRLIFRPVMVFGILFILFLTAFIPTRALFFRVEGNAKISSQQIIEQAAQCGLSFGIRSRNIRSEKIKNAMIQHLPQLQWVGINTQGCVITISVKEKSEAVTLEQTPAVSSLVALRDGVVDKVTALQGEAKCQIGQSVLKGQVLISGYMDLGTHIRATNAKGEVFAHTQRDLKAIYPKDRLEKTVKTEIDDKISLIIGKKQINFYKGSGISPQCCDKIRTVMNITLPGGFVLPISIVKTTVIAYETEAVQTEEADIQNELSRFALRYLQSQMIAGTARHIEEKWYQQANTITLQASYDCYEMIAVTHKEEISKFYE